MMGETRDAGEHARDRVVDGMQDHETHKEEEVVEEQEQE